MTGCHSTKPISGGSTGGSEMLYQHQWDVTEIQGKQVSTSSENQPYLLFSPGQVNKVSGSTGCNRITGSFELTGVNFIKFSPLATTKMACPGNNVEQKFLDALSKVNNWSISNNQLLLSSGKIL